MVGPSLNTYNLTLKPTSTTIKFLCSYGGKILPRYPNFDAVCKRVKKTKQKKRVRKGVQHPYKCCLLLWLIRVRHTCMKLFFFKLIFHTGLAHPYDYFYDVSSVVTQKT